MLLLFLFCFPQATELYSCILLLFSLLFSLIPLSLPTPLLLVLCFHSGLVVPGPLSLLLVGASSRCLDLDHHPSGDSASSLLSLSPLFACSLCVYLVIWSEPWNLIRWWIVLCKYCWERDVFFKVTQSSHCYCLRLFNEKCKCLSGSMINALLISLMCFRLWLGDSW